MNKLILSETISSFKDRYHFIDETEIYSISKRYYMNNFSEGVGKDSIKKLCQDGLKKLSKAKATPGIEDDWMSDVNKIRSSDNDEEIKKIIDKQLRKKFSSKDLPDDFRVGCIEAAWITYSMNRTAGRGKIVSWILAWGVMTRFLYWKLIGQNKVSKLNSYIKNTVKHPVLFTLSSILVFVVVTLIPYLLGYASLKMGGFNAADYDKASGLSGFFSGTSGSEYIGQHINPALASAAGISGVVLGFIGLIKGWLLSILFMLNTSRSNKAEDIVDVG